MPVFTAALLRPQEILRREGGKGTGGPVSCFKQVPFSGWSVKALFGGLTPPVAEGPPKVYLVLVPGRAGR